MIDIPLWQAAIPPILVFAAALPRLLKVRPQNRQTDAATITKAYGHVIDRLEREVKMVREQYTSLQSRLDSRELELAALRTELATERGENSRLRGRVEELERQITRLPRRADDPPLHAA